MAWSYFIDPERNFLSVRASGVFLNSDLQAMRLETSGDPRFNPKIRALFDYLEVTTSGVTFAGVNTWHVEQRYGPESRRAVLVNPGLHQAIGRAFKDSIDEIANGKVLVTASRRDALAWLNDGVPANQLID